MSAVSVRIGRPLAGLSAVLIAMAVGGCGAVSGSEAAVREFTVAAARHDTAHWCHLIARSLLGGPAVPLPPSLLGICVRDDLFLATGSCDREAVVSGASVVADNEQGASAKVRLSTGARLTLARVGGHWLIASITGGTPPRRLADAQAACGTQGSGGGGSSV